MCLKTTEEVPEDAACWLGRENISVATSLHYGFCYDLGSCTA